MLKIYDLIKINPYQILEDTNFPHKIKLEIKKKDFEKIDFEEGKMTYTFSHCLFADLEIENNEEIEFKEIIIQFVDCFIKEININSISSTNISIYFGSSIIAGRIDADSLKNISLNNCLLNNNLFLLNIPKVNISYTEENIFPLRWRKLFKNFNEGFDYFFSKKQSCHLHHCKEIIVSFNENKKKEVGIYKRDYAADKLNKWGYFLSDKEKRILNLNLSIKYSPDIEHTSTKVISTKLTSLILSGFANGINVIENSKIDNIYLDEYSSDSNTTFYFIEPFRKEKTDLRFEIKKSNLNNIWFDNVAFDDWTLISFYRTRFGKTSFTSCKFPNKYEDFNKFETVENINYPEERTDNYFQNRYEVFLQLKNKLDESGNFQESQKFKAISNEALKQINDISWWDRFILNINYYSNNHGLSIKRPFILLLIISVAIYILYLLSLGRIFNSNDLDFNLIGYYFKFLDITHKSTFLVDRIELNGWSVFLDYVNKILVGFFIYQFIAAFRKYGKS